MKILNILHIPRSILYLLITIILLTLIFFIIRDDRINSANQELLDFELKLLNFLSEEEQIFNKSIIMDKSYDRSPYIISAYLSCMSTRNASIDCTLTGDNKFNLKSFKTSLSKILETTDEGMRAHILFSFFDSNGKAEKHNELMLFNCNGNIWRRWKNRFTGSNPTFEAKKGTSYSINSWWNEHC